MQISFRNNSFLCEKISFITQYFISERLKFVFDNEYFCYYSNTGDKIYQMGVEILFVANKSELSCMSGTNWGMNKWFKINTNKIIPLNTFKWIIRAMYFLGFLKSTNVIDRPSYIPGNISGILLVHNIIELQEGASQYRDNFSQVCRHVKNLPIFFNITITI